jgi:ABC-type antimicrobial peptide transport system permease subunit
LSRRKSKNIGIILAVTMGVTLLVGIQITTDTISNAFLTSLLQNQGEVDIRISNATSGAYLKAADRSTIESLIPTAIGIMPELSTKIPGMLGSQFDPSIEAAGISADFPTAFGSFYDWKSDKEMDIANLLDDNTSIIMSSTLAESLDLSRESILPLTLTTEVTNVTVNIGVNVTDGKPILVPKITLEKVDLNVMGIFDSKRPGIGSQYSGVVFELRYLQQWLSLQDPKLNQDQIGSYLIALQTNHFQEEINKDFLKEQMDLLKTKIPEQTNPSTGISAKIYRVNSPRLNFMNVAELIITLITSILVALGLLVMVTGVLLIANVQLMSVEDREFQTGVLRAVGEKRKGVFQSMLIENLFQGILGGVLGLIGGFAFGQAVALYLTSLFGTGTLSVQPVISPQLIILSVIIGVLLSIITGLLPALRASRVNIVEALRGIKVSFKEKSNRNLAFLGLLVFSSGILILLINGVFEKTSQAFWSPEGWDTLNEWQNLLVGFGILFTGVGMMLSHVIDRVKAFNITALALWAAPTVLFVYAMGNWIKNLNDLSPEILMIGLMETMIGSILLVALNLQTVMRGLRRMLIKIKGLKGVAQISPALVSSHKTRSALTFAIFAVVLTLNVIVSTLVLTNMNTLAQTEEASRGIDIIVSLNKPEATLNQTSYTQELYKLDSSITDVIGFRTFNPGNSYAKFVALKDPYSQGFDSSRHMLPMGLGELRPEQIRGNATSASDPNWRYDFYLSSFPDGIRQEANSELTDQQILELSKRSWNLFFNSSYRMPAYNVTLDLLSFLTGESDLSNLNPLVDLTSNSGGNDLEGIAVLTDANNKTIENPILFTDSFMLPTGCQVWIPMNISSQGIPVYQAFTIGGKLDSQRAGGFPLSPARTGGQLVSGSIDVSTVLGRLYLTEQWSNQTDFFGETANSASASRGLNQFNYYLIKTGFSIDDQRIQTIAQNIEDFTNTNDQGYRKLTSDKFIVASATPLYSIVQSSLEITKRIVSFLQIYVAFGLVIGMVGMGIISIRNVAERKREIGMMRAIGFPKKQVMISVLLELIVLGLIGLIIGVANGLLFSVGFANMQNLTLVIPWSDLGLYLSLIILIAIGAGAIPGWIASRIPPAEALRYVG